MLLLHLHRVFFSHRDHFETLLILSLTPLGEGSAAVTPPEHVPHLVKAFVLASGELFVARKFTNVLEAFLPDGPQDDGDDVVGKSALALCVSSPLCKDASQTACIVTSLVIFCHQGHYLVPLVQVLVMFSSSGPSLLHQYGFLLLKFCCVSGLDEAHVIHLVLHLAYLSFSVINIGLSLPVGEDGN